MIYFRGSYAKVTFAALSFVVGELILKMKSVVDFIRNSIINLANVTLDTLKYPGLGW